MASQRSISRAASGWDYIAVGLIVGIVFGAVAAVIDAKAHPGFDGWLAFLAFLVFFGVGFILGPRVWLW